MGSDESWSLLGGKLDFPRRKVGLCSEESQSARKRPNTGYFETDHVITENSLQILIFCNELRVALRLRGERIPADAPTRSLWGVRSERKPSKPFIKPTPIYYFATEYRIKGLFWLIIFEKRQNLAVGAIFSRVGVSYLENGKLCCTFVPANEKFLDKPSGKAERRVRVKASARQSSN